MLIFLSVSRNKILLAFSVYTNGKKITAVDQQSGQILFFNGMKVISMFWVVLGHRFESNEVLVVNQVDVDKVSTVYNFQLSVIKSQVTFSGNRGGMQCMLCFLDFLWIHSFSSLLFYCRIHS